MQSSCPECYCSVLLTRGTKEKPSGESSFFSPQELQYEKNDRIKEDLIKEFELLQEESKYFFNEICYKKRNKGLGDLIRRVDSYSKNDLCAGVASSLRACILMVYQSN